MISKNSFGYWRMDKYDQLKYEEDHLANIAKMKNLDVDVDRGILKKVENSKKKLWILKKVVTFFCDVVTFCTNNQKMSTN